MSGYIKKVEKENKELKANNEHLGHFADTLEKENEVLKEHIVFLEKDSEDYELADYIKKLVQNSADNLGMLENILALPKTVKFEDEHLKTLILFIKHIEPLNEKTTQLMTELGFYDRQEEVKDDN